jgi:hypothetical protein
MAVRTIFTIGISIGLLAAGSSRLALGEPSALDSGVSQLLELGQHYSPRALADARKQHEQLSKLPDYDSRVGYAYALVLIKQRSSDEAIKALDAVLTQQPDLLPAWRAKVWMQMSARKYVAAVQSMRSAAVGMANQRKKHTAGAAIDNAPDRTETARFFGQMFGFLEGPRGNAIADDELRKSKQYIQSRLGDDREAFSEGEEAISAQFVKLRERLQKSESEAVAQLKDQEAAVKQQQKKVDKAETDVDFQAEKLQTATKAQLEDLTKQAESIQKNIMQAQFRLNALDHAITAQQGQATLQNMALNQPGSQDAFVRTAAIVQLNRIQNNLQQLVVQRTTLAAQIAGLSQQLNVVGVQRDSLLGDAAQTSADLSSQTAQLKRREKELGRARKTAAKGQTSAGSKAHTLTGQQQAFGTYVPFPFEAEKERVLNWFGH